LFEVDFSTIARWENGRIVEKNLPYDLMALMRQIGLSD
jgi:predicted ester cyclase